MKIRRMSFGCITLIIGISLLLYPIIPICVNLIFSTIHKPELNNKDLNIGIIGDWFGGTMGPFIGIAGVVVTFLAFKIQYDANEIQSKNIKLQFFENRFFEMLKIQREIVEGMYIENDFSSGPSTKGNNCFICFYYEFKYLYLLIKEHIESEDYNDKKVHRNSVDVKTYIAIAYTIFFNGEGDTSNISVEGILSKYNFEKDTINNILTLIKYQKREPNNKFEIENSGYPFDPQYTPFKGYQNLLGYYYRNLYQIILYVENEHRKSPNEINVKNYMKMVKSQMTNFEQIMLFLNSFYIHGRKWQNEKLLVNHKLISNIPLPYLTNLYIDPKEIEPFKSDIRNYLDFTKEIHFFEWDNSEI